MDTNTVVTMGIISKEVYEEKYFSDQAVKNKEPIKGTTYKVLDKADTATGLQALLLQDGDKYVIAFRGTEQLSIADWVTNFQTGVDNYSPQFNDALAFVQKILADDDLDIDAEDITLTGHSLGGILTQAVGATLQINAPTERDDLVTSANNIYYKEKKEAS